MYTQCPKCQSVFMVSDTDITAHEGLVRCGNCYSVFNASANLTDSPEGGESNDQASTVSATPVELPPGASTVSVSSDFTFNFVEEPAEEDEQAVTESSAVSDETESTDSGDEDLNPFPEPDFKSETLADTAEEKPDEEPEEESNSLLYFGPDEVDDTGPASVPEDEPMLDTTLLQDSVFNSAMNPQDDADAIEDDVPADPGLEPEPLDAPSEPSLEPPADFSEEEDFSGPEIAEGTNDSDEDFALPDFSPLEGLDSETSDEPAMSQPEEGTTEPDEDIEHVETHLDNEALWPGSEVTEEPTDNAADDTLPDPAVTPRFMEDETHDALQAYDDAVANLGLDSPGAAEETDDTSAAQADSFETMDIDEELLALDDADSTDTETGADIQDEPAIDEDGFDEETELPDEPEEPESVFITSEQDEVDEAYQAINVENDDAFHSSNSNDFPLPDELEDFDKQDNSDIDKLLKQAVDGQEAIDAKMAEKESEEAEEPDIGTPDIDDDLENEPQLNPAAQAPASGESGGLTAKLGAAFAAVADKLRFGRRSYHGLDTYETQEHQDTLLVRQLEHESHGSLFDFISPVARKGLLVVFNLLLIAGLLFQLGKYFMDDLVQVSALRPALEAGCRLAGCTVPEPSNPATIEQLSSKMTVVDGKQGGLRIAVTLINRDRMQQPFPAMELSLTNRAGQIISRKVVRAEEYLGSDASNIFMQPGQAEDINILLRTPAVRVDGFELKPVKLHWLDKN